MSNSTRPSGIEIEVDGFPLAEDDAITKANLIADTYYDNKQLFVRTQSWLSLYFHLLKGHYSSAAEIEEYL